jgi:hypothetical protein
LPAVVGTPTVVRPVAARPARSEIDVELIPPATASGPTSPWDLTRRDFVMLGVGAGGVLAAVATGYGLAKLFRQAGGPVPALKEMMPQDEQEKE